MRIAVGTDERTALTESIAAKLSADGHAVVVVADGIAWPDAGRAVGEAIV
jgi:ribose 5-phosphate isomerase B